MSAASAGEPDNDGSRTRYAMVGTGGRARLFYEAIAGRYSAGAKLVALCDPNQTRMHYVNRVLAEQYDAPEAATYKPDAFDRMVAAERPDVVIVCSIDRTHDRYIVAALELGCRVITEKPMTIDAERCRKILQAGAANPGKIRVAFNYRYAPHSTAVRDLIRSGVIGDPLSVHFEWLLDTSHGADYFRRWHRNKMNSGGLLVHKSTHHFDLVNFWLATRPERVFAFGGLRFYGSDNARSRGIDAPWDRTTGVPEAAGSPFALDMSKSETMTELYLKAEHEDGYLRDQNVFGDGIDIEDTLSVLVRYRNKVTMSYSLTAHSPWEGFNVAINGTGGRLELNVCETSYVNSGGAKEDEGALAASSLRVRPHHAPPYDVSLARGEGSHGGGDLAMLEEIFADHGDGNRAANERDGAFSILTGIAANQSLETGLPVNVDDLVQVPE